MYEPFWDQCGAMLTTMGLGGMDEMGEFYDKCLETLYPPGECGQLCNLHTYDCYLQEVHQACCDLGGLNCVAGRDIPLECPVGCGLVFPAFVDKCHDHIAANGLDAEFQAFREECLDVDGLDLVEYAIDLKQQGCQIDLTGGALPGGGHRRMQGPTSQWFSSRVAACAWDDLDNFAEDVDAVCCMNRACQNRRPSTCSAACAVAMHEFFSMCGDEVAHLLGDADARFLDMQAFDADCMAGADPDYFIHAIENAVCPQADGSLPGCGDRTVEGGEMCDDGNTQSDDGCDSLCQIEPGFSCSSPGHACVDIDECALGSPCGGAHQRCENLPGDYVCLCEPGFVEEAGRCNSAPKPTGRQVSVLMDLPAMQSSWPIPPAPMVFTTSLRTGKPAARKPSTAT